MKISTIIGAVSTALLMATAYAYDFTPIDWSAQSGTVTLSSGKCYLVTEADMQYVNALKLTISGTIVYSNATTEAKINVSSGSGTIVKMGESSQSFKGQYWQFNGKFIVEEGTATCSDYYSFGDPQNSGQVCVRDGATAVINFATAMCKREFCLAGTGVNGQGALVVKKSGGLIQKVSLDADALIVSEVADNVIIGKAAASSGRTAAVNPATLKLNGHTLTLGGSSTRIGLANCEVTDSVGGGKIVYAAAENGERVVRFSGTNTVLSVPIVFEGDTTVQLYNSCAPISSPVTANGSLTFTYGCDSGAGAGLTDACNKWTGDIAFTTAGSALRFTPSNASYQLTLTGNVSGDANLEVGTTGTPASGVVRLGGHNTYTGTSVVNGTSDLTVLVDYDDSIPNAATKLTVNGGIVTPRVVSNGEGGYTWTPSAYLDYVAPQVNGKTGAKVSVYTTDLTDGEFLFSGTEIATKLADAAGLVWSALGSGAGRYTLTGPFEEDKPLNLNIPSGTVRLTGEEPIRLGTTLVTGTADNQGGTLLLDGAEDVSFGTDSIFLGNPSSTTPNSLGAMIVTNSYIHGTVASTPNNETGSIWVGHRTQGILRIEDGAVVSNGLCIGGSPSAYSTTVSHAGVGAVYQRGGTVYPRSASAVGVGNHGYYELCGGSVEIPSGCDMTIGYGHSCLGIWMQYGGKVNSKTGIGIGRSNNYNTGVLYIRKGPFEVAGDLTTAYADGNHAYITLDGPEALFLNANQVFYCNNSGSGTTTINLNNGGVLQTGYLKQQGQAGESNAHSILVNFNGGVWRRCWFYDNPFSEGAAKAHLTVKVYEKGVCFDTYYPGNISGQAAGGKTINTTGVNIEGATGSGVQAIALPEGGLSGYIAAPYVQITSTDAGAYGATAVAEIDSETATVTNILVTSHGWGYTPEKTTVTLCYNSSVMYTVPKANVTIGPNTVGGLTKIGAGTLNVYGTNTWAQWTRVDAGTVVAKTNGSIPSGTELILNGGTLDLGGFDADAERPTTFSGISGTGGEVKNGIVKVVGEWKVSAKKFIDRETTVLAGNLDLTACTKIVLTDTEVLDEAAEQLKRLELFKTTSTAWPTDLVIEGVPQGWSMKRTATGLKLGFDRGALLIVR